MTKIQILENVDEPTIPFISLTRSRNGQTGTATFFFQQPSAFNWYSESKIVPSLIQQVTLINKEQKIQTGNIKINFFEGKPFLLESVFVFLKRNDWYLFLQFMHTYAKDKGLFYSDFDNSFNSDYF